MARAGLGEGWTCLFANDISEKKAESYRANWGDQHLHVGDVFEVGTHQLTAQADVMWGSFPCQDLSLAGHGRGLSGERSGSFWGFWQLVRQLRREGRKPCTVVLENVYGMLTAHDGKDFDQISRALAQEGYQFGAMVIDAVHFTPQSRPRLFIVGIDEALSIPKHLASDLPTPAWHPSSVIRAWHRLPDRLKTSWIWWNPPPPLGRGVSLDELIEIEPTGVAWNDEAATLKLLQSMTEVNRRKVLEAQRCAGIKVGTIYKRTRAGIVRAEARFDGIAGCLRTPSGGSSRQTILVVNGPHVRSRLISPREAARLMGLPDTYHLPKNYNDAYHLLGDGVVVPVVAHLRQHLFDAVIAVNGRHTKQHAA